MNKDTVIFSMTTWPPRYSTTADVMGAIVKQVKDDGLQDRVHCVLVLSEEECSASNNRLPACLLMDTMEDMGVEVIIDKGNIRSHKKLMPTLEKYTDKTIVVVDDDTRQQAGWVKTFLKDHEAHPEDIIYGMSTSRIFVDENRQIIEERPTGRLELSVPGQVSIDLKPANGASGTLYPAGTFQDDRFFDRALYMEVSPSSDETWQWAFAKIAGKTFRCLSGHNLPYSANARQDCSLFSENKYKYTDIHNAIAREVPEYLEALLNDAKSDGAR